MPRRVKPISPTRPCPQWQRDCEEINALKAKRRRRKSWRQRMSVAMGVTIAANMALAGWWLSESGRLQQLSQASGQWMSDRVAGSGFALRRIEVNGLSQVQAHTVVQAGGLQLGQSMFAQPLHEVRARIEAMPEIRSVRLQRALPDRLVLWVEERKPAALWQHAGESRWLDQDGIILREEWAEAMRHTLRYPVITGANAPEHLAQFWQWQRSKPDALPAITAARYIGQRRWDVWFEGGLVVKLPMVSSETVATREQLWHKVSQIMTHYNTTTTSIATLDMRLDDRAYITFKEKAEPEVVPDGPLLLTLASEQET